jgi:hypothetical protein
MARAAVRGHPVARELRRHRLRGDALWPEHVAEAIEVEPERCDQDIARLVAHRGIRIGKSVKEARQPGGRGGGVTLSRGRDAAQILYRRADRADALPVSRRRAGRGRIDHRAECRGRRLDHRKLPVLVAWHQVVDRPHSRNLGEADGTLGDLVDLTDRRRHNVDRADPELRDRDQLSVGADRLAVRVL